MDDSLRRAAREGDVSYLYALIQGNGNVFKHFDEVEFIETPLHIAADVGCIKFAMEIMSLKPSFARKLNPQGLTPLHLAVEKGHKELALLLVEIDKDLVRVKGKNGETPLHYLITSFENSQEKVLCKFLKNCSESIRDMTNEKRTALHIAVTSKKEKALKILCNRLWKTNYRQDIINQKDENGDTALHIAARNNQQQMIKLLLKFQADKHATNKDGFTALGVAKVPNYRESISILHGYYIPRVSPFIYKLQKRIVKFVKKASSLIFHDIDKISMEDRNALLVILGLLLTATYQASLTSPGGVWQADTKGFEELSNKEKKRVGKSVMKEFDFLLFYTPTSAVFIGTFFLTLGLLKPFPRGFKTALQVLLAFLAISFYQSISCLAPTDLAAAIIILSSGSLFVLMMFMCFAYRVSKVSVLILGCWLLPTFFGLYDYGLVGFFSGNIIIGCLLFVFLYDEFLKGTVLVIGLALLSGLGPLSYVRWAGLVGLVIAPMIIVLGCWLFLSLCRFCIKRCIQCCKA